MKRTAFTLLEVIFVLIVIGILAVLAMPSLNRDPLAEATEQMANHIRFTQHLAMVDDRFDQNNPQWYSQMWIFRIRRVADFNNGGQVEWFYEVYSDRSNDGDSTQQEEATDPVSGQSLGNGTLGNTCPDDKIINLTRKFGIQNVVMTENGVVNNLRRISFDNLGRPYQDADPNAGVNWRAMIFQNPVVITITGEDGRQSRITVEPETGYVSVSY